MVKMNNDADYFMDMGTGEITFSHRTAVDWLRAGARIGVYRRNKLCVTWEP